MLRHLILFCTFLGAFCVTQAQNLFPNPGFEQFTVCPTNLGHLDNHAVAWTRASNASPDYAACGYTGNSAIRTTPATGSAAAGIWGIASHGTCSSDAYSEPVKCTLTATLVSGQSYQVSMKVQVDAIGSSTSSPNSCMDFGIYLYNSASPPANPGYCTFAVTPQWAVVGSSIVQGTYTTFTGTFTAGTNWNTAIIGAFRNANTPSGPCNNSNTSRMYFNLDDVVIQDVTVLGTDVPVLHGNAFNDFHDLTWELRPGQFFRDFQLERSPNGKAFTVEKGLQVQDLERSHYSFKDETPLAGTNFYRLAATDLDGKVAYSNVLRMQHGFAEPEEKEQFSYVYDREISEISFELDAGLGGAYRMDILDLRTVASQAWTLAGGVHNLQMEIGDLAKGIYLIRFEGQNQIVKGAKFVR